MSEQTKEKLHELYRRKLNETSSVLIDYNFATSHDKRATNPFLLSIPDNYDAFKNKIMIFGQETNTWCKECGKRSEFSNKLERTLELYTTFYLKGGINKYCGPFWNEFKRIRREVSKTKNAVFLWNNINKIGRVGKGNIPEINKIQFEYFQVIREEIRLLSPNIMVFLTGPDYDNFIKKNIGEFSQKKIGESLYELSFNQGLEEIKSFKTYHPNALYKLSKNRKVIPKLIDEIKNVCL